MEYSAQEIKVIEYIERAFTITRQNDLFVKHSFPMISIIDIAKMLQLEDINKVEITGVMMNNKDYEQLDNTKN